MKPQTALISVYDKTGIVEFARALHDEFGIVIISTGGTATTLRDAGIPVTLVEEITGFPELMNGRVKTLHPKIHAGILADRDNPEHMQQLADHGIKPIDIVVVNLYPFEKTIADPNCTFEQAIEMIDIGGPSMIRAAAKNHKDVLIVSDSAQFQGTLECLRGEKVGDWRRFLLTKAFQQTAPYDIAIHNHFGKEYWKSPFLPAMLLRYGMMTPSRSNELRYGENPHTRGSVYVPWGEKFSGLFGCDSVDAVAQTMSYNNYVDADAALALCAELSRAFRGKSTLTQSGGPTLSRSVSETDDNVEDRLSAGQSENVVEDRLSAGQSRTIREEQVHRRHLPHIQRPDASYFLTFRLKGGTLSENERDIVAESLLHGDAVGQYALHGAIVMPNHVHLLLTPLEEKPGSWSTLGVILKGIKGSTARIINKGRGASGALWQDEYWDTIIRDAQHMSEAMEYLLQNAERAALASMVAEYAWCLIDPALGWNAYARQVGIAEIYSLQVGRAPQNAPVRHWHAQLNDRQRNLLNSDSCDRLRTGPPQGSDIDRLRTGPPQGSDIDRMRTGAPQRSEFDRLRTGSPRFVCTFIKHTNACGVGVSAQPEEAYRRAYLGDPNAAMGGILACNFKVDADFATAVMETYDRLGKPLKEAGAAHAPGGFFIEVWIAPEFTDEALAIIRGTTDQLENTKEFAERFPAPPKKAWGERVRLLAVGDMNAIEADGMQYRSILGGMLVQTADVTGLNEHEWKVVTARQPTDVEMADLRLAWLTCKHTKSNAITICKDGQLIGNGAGQMSRVMSCRIATWLARENGHEADLAGAVAASDAFFPFSDGPKLLIDAGVTAIIQPGGSKRDDETIALCNECGVTMINTGTRHFRH